VAPEHEGVKESKDKSDCAYEQYGVPVSGEEFPTFERLANVVCDEEEEAGNTQRYCQWIAGEE